FVPDIQRSTDLPFLNMTLSATALAAQNTGVGGTVGILASPATQTTRLFHDALEAQGCSALYPDDQGPILAAIKAIKINGVTPDSIKILQQQADKLAKAGAQCILIGCSEFSLMSGDITSPVRLIDTLDVLVDQITAFSGATRRPH
ncbi:MAG: aspartate/glutamate racemase family protein, partial [Sulfitobacter sp.]